MAFETETVIPDKIGIVTYRTTNFNSGRNEEGFRNNLNMLEEGKDEATLWVTAYKQRMTKYYNSQVRSRRFAVGDLVLRKDSLVTQDPSKEKLDQTGKGLTG